MDYLIEIRAWAMGYDEAEEFCEEIAQLAAERGLGLRENDQSEEIRAIVSLKPQNGALDSADGRAASVLSGAADGAQLLLVPSELGTLRERPAAV